MYSFSGERNAPGDRSAGGPPGVLWVPALLDEDVVARIGVFASEPSQTLTRFDFIHSTAEWVVPPLRPGAPTIPRRFRSASEYERVGRLEAGLKCRIAIFLHLPIDGTAVVTASHNPCAAFTGGKSNEGPIAFKPPLALNDGPTPKVSRTKLHAYEQAPEPFAELRFTSTNQLKTMTFDFGFDWNWKATGNQIGNPAIPATGQYFSNRLTITSHAWT